MKFRRSESVAARSPRRGMRDANAKAARSRRRWRSGRHQRNLNYQQKDPSGKEGAVNVDDQTRKRRTKDAGEEIGSSESH
jgi:hypothetical protein